MYRDRMVNSGIIGALKAFLRQNPPDKISLPDTVGDAEAVHAVQEQYGDAGLECTIEQAEQIVREARANSD